MELLLNANIIDLELMIYSLNNLLIIITIIMFLNLYFK